MCFYDGGDWDWHAGVHEESFMRCEKKTHCEECGKAIEQGEWMRHVLQLEYEMCQLCEDEESFDYEEGHDCGGECHYGETFQCDTCKDCLKILAAVYEYEKKAKCPEYARQPLVYGMLNEDIFDCGYKDEYLDEITGMFPELKSHRFVAAALEWREQLRQDALATA